MLLYLYNHLLYCRTSLHIYTSFDNLFHSEDIDIQYQAFCCFCWIHACLKTIIQFCKLNMKRFQKKSMSTYLFWLKCHYCVITKEYIKIGIIRWFDIKHSTEKMPISFLSDHEIAKYWKYWYRKTDIRQILHAPNIWKLRI